MEGNPNDAELLSQLDCSNQAIWDELREIANTLSAVDRKNEKPKMEGNFIQSDYPIYTQRVDRMIELLYKVNAVTPQYHWMQYGPPSYSPDEELSPANAIRLATCICRSDRFVEGTIESAFQDGVFDKILASLIKWYDANQRESR